MKRVFISILLFFLIAHFVIPGIYYSYNGFFSIYMEFDDLPAIVKSYLLNGISLITACVIIWFLPGKEDQIKPQIYNITPLYYFSIALGFYTYLSRGGYQGVVSGNMAGSFLTYLALFLSPLVILTIVLFYQQKKYNVGLLLLSSILYVTLTGSRSAIISILLIILIFPAFKNFGQYKRKILRYVYILVIASPFMFVFASKLRGIDLDLLNNTFVLNAIFGRLSMVELGAIPIYYHDNGGFNSDLFYEKYGILHQLALIIDSVIPGNIFTYDVMPNQYYRAIFLDYNIDAVQDVYMSMNMTLPVYFYMYTGFAGALILTIFSLVGYFLLWRKYKDNTVVSIALITQLYPFLYSFDFVMWFSQVFVTILSLLSIKIFVFLRKEAIRYIRHHEKKVI